VSKVTIFTTNCGKTQTSDILLKHTAIQCAGEKTQTRIVSDKIVAY